MLRGILVSGVLLLFLTIVNLAFKHKKLTHSEIKSAIIHPFTLIYFVTKYSKHIKYIPLSFV
jgi:succinate dehydrogenase hydrophobic anchor subunit